MDIERTLSEALWRKHERLVPDAFGKAIAAVEQGALQLPDFTTQPCELLPFGCGQTVMPHACVAIRQ